MRVAVVMPSRNRPLQLERNITDLINQPLPYGVDVLIVAACVEVTDTKSLNVVRKLQRLYPFEAVTVSLVCRDENTTCVQGFNLGYEALRGVADWYVLGSDDQVYQDGWLKEACGVAAKTGAAVIGLNDGHTNIDGYAPHFMMTGAFIETYLGGVMVPPVYESWWFDREICEVAQQAGLYAPAWEALAEHLHPDWKTAVMDDTYKAAWGSHDKDKTLYLTRKAQGYPLDWTVVDES